VRPWRLFHATWAGAGRWPTFNGVGIAVILTLVAFTAVSGNVHLRAIVLIPHGHTRVGADVCEEATLVVNPLWIKFTAKRVRRVNCMYCKAFAPQWLLPVDTFRSTQTLANTTALLTGIHLLVGFVEECVLALLSAMLIASNWLTFIVVDNVPTIKLLITTVL
jgi:hypothetical protein